MLSSHKQSTTWDHVADWYDEHLEGKEGTYQRDLILPNMLRLVEPKRGHTILDLACGQGFFSRAFAARGATVIGADVSSALIARAKEHTGEQVTFHVAPAHALPFIADHAIDIVTIVLAIQNIENMRAVFDECARVLAPGGRLFLVLTHPAFRVPQRSSWEFDDKKRVQYRRVDGYMREAKVSIQMHPGDKPSETTVSFHRPLQVYSKTLGNAGFAITRLEEWVSERKSNPGPRAGAENHARNEFPLFLMIEAQQVS